MGVLVYLTIGIIMITIAAIHIAISDKEFRKSYYHKPSWWVATILCMIFWPAVIVSGIWDMFHGRI